MNENRRVVLYTILLVFLRKKVLGVLFIILSIPAAIVATYSLVNNTLVEEAMYLYKSIEQGKSYFLTTNIMKYTDCTTIRLSYSNTAFEDKNMVIPIIIVDKETYTKYTSYWPRKTLAKNKTIYVSIPSILKTHYGLKPGKNLSICLSNTCHSMKIDLVHSGRGVFGSAIILVTTNESNNHNIGKEYCMFTTNNDSLQENILTPLIKSLSTIQVETSILLITAYFPIMILGHKKIKKYTSREQRILYELGVSEKTLRTNIVFILFVLGIAMSLYGVFLATLLTHLSLWLLRLYGIIIVSRPLPDPISLTPFITVFLSLYLIAAITVFRGERGET